MYCSFISFLHTKKASPMNIEDSCFDIDQASVNAMYLGNSWCWYASPINLKIKWNSLQALLMGFWRWGAPLCSCSTLHYMYMNMYILTLQDFKFKKRIKKNALETCIWQNISNNTRDKNSSKAAYAIGEFYSLLSFMLLDKMIYKHILN